MIICFSHFINDVILVLIVKIVSMLLDILNMKENSMITVRFSMIFICFLLFVCDTFRLLSTFVWSQRCRPWYRIRSIINRKLKSIINSDFTGAMINGLTTMFSFINTLFFLSSLHLLWLLL
jgi:hypothetical protein